ncbi:hypothetical protein V8C35DRAFT_311860 [Trichoderma chlorosporum]
MMEAPVQGLYFVHAEWTKIREYKEWCSHQMDIWVEHSGRKGDAPDADTEAFSRLEGEIAGCLGFGVDPFREKGSNALSYLYEDMGLSAAVVTERSPSGVRHTLDCVIASYFRYCRRKNGVGDIWRGSTFEFASYSLLSSMRRVEHESGWRGVVPDCCNGGESSQCVLDLRSLGLGQMQGILCLYSHVTLLLFLLLTECRETAVDECLSRMESVWKRVSRLLKV